MLIVWPFIFDACVVCLAAKEEKQIIRIAHHIQSNRVYQRNVKKRFLLQFVERYSVKEMNDQ